MRLQDLKGGEKPALYTYLVGAAICAGACAGDIREYRIPNGLILIGYAAGSFFTYLREGSSFFPAFAKNALWPILFLYFLFFIGALGSGDVKLFSVASTFLGPVLTLRLIVLSFLLGGLLALIKMLAAGDLFFRLAHLRQHVSLCFFRKQIIPYVSCGTCRDLHFAVPITISYVLIILFSTLRGL